MKTLFTLLSTILIAGTSLAQFSTPEDYVLRGVTSYKQIDYDSLEQIPLEDVVAPLTALTNTKTGQCIEVYELLDWEMFDTAIVETLENPGLENVEQIVRVQLVFIACCAWIETYYYMEMEDGKLQALPQLPSITSCDGPSKEQPEHVYIFPSEENGEEGKIIRAEFYWDYEQPDTYNTPVAVHDEIADYNWNGKRIETK